MDQRFVRSRLLFLFSTGTTRRGSCLVLISFSAKSPVSRGGTVCCLDLRKAGGGLTCKPWYVEAQSVSTSIKRNQSGQFKERVFNRTRNRTAFVYQKFQTESQKYPGNAIFIIYPQIYEIKLEKSQASVDRQEVVFRQDLKCIL